MWNVLLDPLPEEWEGYPIDSDFQTGILISQCLVDSELTEYEKYATAINLLFPDENNRPNVERSIEGLSWYLTEFQHDNPGKKEKHVEVMDFDIDQWRIYSAFLMQYHIDLNTEKLHWFVFMGLLSNLNECSFTNVMSIRQRDINPQMSKKEKESLIEAKKVFAIKKVTEEPLTEEEQKRVEEFMKYIGKEVNR